MFEGVKTIRMKPGNRLGLAVGLLGLLLFGTIPAVASEAEPAKRSLFGGLKKLGGRVWDAMQDHELEDLLNQPWAEKKCGEIRITRELQPKIAKVRRCLGHREFEPKETKERAEARVARVTEQVSQLYGLDDYEVWAGQDANGNWGVYSEWKHSNDTCACEHCEIVDLLSEDGTPVFVDFWYPSFFEFSWLLEHEWHQLETWSVGGQETRLIDGHEVTREYWKERLIYCSPRVAEEKRKYGRAR